MKPEIWVWLRWVVALGLCALVVVVSVPMAIDAVTRSVVFGDEADAEEDAEDEAGQAVDPDDEAEPAADVPTGSVSDGEADPDADFVVREGTVRQASAEELSLSDEDAVVLVFPLIGGDPACVSVAELEISLLDAERTEIAVYAGAVHDDADDDDDVGDPRRDDTVHALALTDGSPGRLRWDVTDLYRSWASGDLASPGTPFAIVVAVPDEPAEVTFASSESDDEDPPTLVWEGDPDCD